MDLWKSLKVVGRHAGAVALVLVVAAVAAAGLLSRMSTTYEASAEVVLLGSSVQDTVTGARYNPYALFGDNELITASLLSRVVNSDSGAARIAKAGGTGSYDVHPAKVVSGVAPAPLIDVVASGTSRAEAVATLNAVIKTMGDELQDRQAASGAPAPTWLKAEVLTSTAPATVTSNRLRVVGGVGLLGLAAAVSLAFLLEGAAERRAMTSTPTGRHARPPFTPPAAAPLLAEDPEYAAHGNGNGHDAATDEPARMPQAKTPAAPRHRTGVAVGAPPRAPRPEAKTRR